MPICAILLIIGFVAVLLSKDRKKKKKKNQAHLHDGSKKQSIASFTSTNSFNDSSNNLKNTIFGNFDTILEETAENSLKIEFKNEKKNMEKNCSMEKDSNSLDSHYTINSDYIEMTMRI